jgi:hypothetical protein
MSQKAVLPSCVIDLLSAAASRGSTLAHRYLGEWFEDLAEREQDPLRGTIAPPGL